MIVTTQKNPKTEARAEVEPDAEMPETATEDADEVRAEESADAATTRPPKTVASSPTKTRATTGTTGMAGCSNAGVPTPSAVSGPGSTICVAARCRCYSLPHLLFRDSLDGGSGKSIRSSSPANRRNRRPSPTRRC